MMLAGGPLLLVLLRWMLTRLKPVAGHAWLRHAVFQLAEHYGGDYAVTFPTVRFRDRSRQVAVTPLSVDAGSRTALFEVTAPWFDDQFRVELFAEGWFSRVKRRLGMKDIEVDDPPFDREFVVASNDEPRCRALLNEDVRQRLQALRRGDEQFSVSIQGGQFRATCRLGDAERLIPFVDRLLALHRELIESDNPLMPPEDDGPRPPRRLASVEIPRYICQVCGERIQQRHVECKGCRTPHHRECWEYLGGCSTYGCFGRSCTGRGRPRV